jgi:aryl-alcohol dehydrogenase-like predicted oxidoreductase
MSHTSVDGGDVRAIIPRFSAESVANNLQSVDELTALARAKGCTPGQLALAWLLALPLELVPISGARRVAHVEEDVGATNVVIDVDEMTLLSKVFRPGNVFGERYAAADAEAVPYGTALN